MGLETATKISELVETNPTGTDPKSQGDDHLRLIKSVLKDDAYSKADLIIASGTYTPTLAIYSNVASQSVVGVWRYIRVGGCVHVSGKLSVTPTAASALTSFYATLPVPSALAATNQASGHVSARNSGGMVSGYVSADASGDRAWASYTQVANTNLMDVDVSFMYQVL